MKRNISAGLRLRRFLALLASLLGVGILALSCKAGDEKARGEAASHKAPASIKKLPPQSVPEKEPVERYNVVFVSIDTVRADELECYGAKGPAAAPTWCGLAERGTLFERAYSPAPVTVPAMTAILSGSLVTNEAPRELAAYYRNQEFLAQKLAKRGYRTAALTDHLGLGDLEAGRRAVVDFHKGFDLFVNIGVDNRTWGSAELVDRAIAYLDARSDEPVFLWIHFFDPHFEFVPPESLARLFGYEEETCGRVRPGIGIVELRKIRHTLDTRELACLRALHRAEIRYVDDELFRLVQRIEEPDLAPRTNLIVFADHAEEFMERDWIGHERTLFDEMIRVPFVMAGPSVPARRVERPVSTISAHEAALELAAGRPLEVTEDVVYARTFHYYPTGNPKRPYRSVPNSFAAIGEAHKHVLNPSHNRHRCYDLTEDPAELNDLCGGAGNAPGAPRALLEWIEKNKAAPAPAPAEAIEAQNQVFERLRALGYFRD